LNDGKITSFRGVRVHVSTGYTRVEGNRRASRNSRVSSSPTRNPTRHDSQLSASMRGSESVHSPRGSARWEGRRRRRGWLWGRLRRRRRRRAELRARHEVRVEQPGGGGAGPATRHVEESALLAHGDRDGWSRLRSSRETQGSSVHPQREMRERETQDPASTQRER
jgi:hypothetical protein